MKPNKKRLKQAKNGNDKKNSIGDTNLYLDYFNNLSGGPWKAATIIVIHITITGKKPIIFYIIVLFDRSFLLILSSDGIF